MSFWETKERKQRLKAALGLACANQMQQENVSPKQTIACVLRSAKSRIRKASPVEAAHEKGEPGRAPLDHKAAERATQASGAHLHPLRLNLQDAADTIEAIAFARRAEAFADGGALAFVDSLGEADMTAARSFVAAFRRWALVCNKAEAEGWFPDLAAAFGLSIRDMRHLCWTTGVAVMFALDAQALNDGRAA